jgi:diaminopimelate epimerase
LQLTSSRWDAQGNIYLVTTDAVTADDARAAADESDGVIQIVASGPDWVDIVIWNPDGSRAEMSGNGTRIAARWHGGDEVDVRVGPREVKAVLREDGLVEQDLGDVTRSEPEEVDGIRFIAVDVGNPHAVVDGDPDELPRIGPVLETHERFPQRTNVQVARRLDHGEIEARVWERGAGETASSGTSAVAVAAAFGYHPVIVRFPGGPLEVRFEGRRAFLAGPAVRVG